MKQVGWLNLTSWYMTGVLISVSVRLAVSLVHHLRFGPESDMGGPISSLLTPPMLIILFCLLCAPHAIVSLYGWARIARPRPVIENAAMLRYLGLGIVGFFVAAGSYSIYLLLVIAFVTGHFPYFGGQGLENPVLAFTYIVLAVVAPRVVIPRLRKPLVWRGTA